MSAPKIVWKETRSISYAAAKRRTAHDPVGTAYWMEDGSKHRFYVKVGPDRWLCFGGKTIMACLEQYARKPGAGGHASDYLIANGIATSDGDDPPMLRVAQIATKPKRRARPLTARLTPNEIWCELEARGAEVVRRPVSVNDISAAQAALGFRFPPSYLALVKAGGAPAIGSAKRRADELSFAVLTPKEVVRFTKEMRRLDVDMFEDPASLPRVKKQLANAVMFQFGRDPGDGHVFLVDSADAEGEMRIADYSHDYVEELDWRRSSKVVFRSLSASTLRFAKEIAEYLP